MRGDPVNKQLMEENFEQLKRALEKTITQDGDIIPLMREDSILEEESVKLGKFNGYETIAYIDSVMSLYDAFCTICPES